MLRVLKCVYNNDTNFILDIINDFKEELIIESYNVNMHKEAKTARGIQTNFGTKNVPLIVFEDENLIEVDAIWSENNPDWKKEIKNKVEV